MALTISYLVGSLSRDSINRKLVNAIVDLGTKEDVGEDEPFEFVELSIAELPLYNSDLDDDYPPEAIKFKQQLQNSAGLIIATPEYNRSIPGVLKNAIDWGSRPYGDSAFPGLPVGIVGASVGAPGTAMAQQHLRNILAYLDAPTLGQPEVYIQYTDERFGPDGEIRDAETREFLTDWVTAFGHWVRTFATEVTKHQ